MDIRSTRAFDHLVDKILEEAGVTNSWTDGGEIQPDYSTGELLLSSPLHQQAPTASGRFARAMDYWVAHEFRRAGFADDEVWPRPRQPRVLPQELAALDRAIPCHPRFEPPGWLRSGFLSGSSRSRILGAYYAKEVDVVMAHWDRGLELMVSGRSMLSSYQSNLHNRSEDLLGDADNFRRRYRILRDKVPEDLGVPQFFGNLIKTVLTRTPVEYHQFVRRLRRGEAVDPVHRNT